MLWQQSGWGSEEVVILIDSLWGDNRLLLLFLGLKIVEHVLFVIYMIGLERQKIKPTKSYLSKKLLVIIFTEKIHKNLNERGSLDWAD